MEESKYPRVVLMTPAYNEENNISVIIKSGLKLIKWGTIDDFVVIDDGSTDNTASVARNLGAKVISLPENKGKGTAFLEGLLYAKRNGADILISVDADLVSPLTERQIAKAILMIWKEKQNMVVFPVYEGGGYTGCNSSGQRAIKVSALNFLFEGDGLDIRLSNSKPAKRFMEMCKGYGLEKTLDYYIKSTSYINRLDFAMRFLEPFRHMSAGCQNEEVDRCLAIIWKRKRRMELLKRVRSKGWHRKKGFMKKVAAHGGVSLVKILTSSKQG
ncbi:MAG: glycosyltransferase family 2 protein [Candidatus Anstonellales archaeon]